MEDTTKNESKITIILLKKDEEEKTIQKAIRSVEQQDTEASAFLEILDLTKEENISYRLCEILSSTATKYFCVFDSDGYWKDKKFLERAICFLDNYENYSSYGTNSKLISEQGHSLGNYVEFNEVRLSNLRKQEYTTYSIGDFFTNLAMLPHNIVFRNLLKSKPDIKEELIQIDEIQNLETEFIEALYILHLKYGIAKFVNTDSEVLKQKIDDNKTNFHKNIFFAQKYLVYSQWYRNVFCDKLKECAFQYYKIALDEKEAFERVHLSSSDKINGKGLLLSKQEQKCFEQLQKAYPDLKNLSGNMCYSFGDKNPDKIFFVIYASVRNWGLFTTFFYILYSIDFAIKNNCIPIIDFKHFYMLELQDITKYQLENAWEYYFKQPVEEYSLEEVYQSKNVIMSDLIRFSALIGPDWNNMMPTDPIHLNNWNSCIQKYCRLNTEILSEVDAYCEEQLFEKRRILGVGIRASYRALYLTKSTLIRNHPIQPSLEQYIESIKRYREEWNCEYIFVSSDDREYLERLIEIFGEKCLYLERARMHCFINDIVVYDETERRKEFSEISTRKRNEQYLKEVYILSRCHCLYSSKGSGSEAAYFINGGKYDYYHIYNEGEYR